MHRAPIRPRRAACLLLLALLCAPGCLGAERFVAAQQASNDALIQRQLAHHVGVLAYLYGYPLVDMHRQMHNETHRVASDQAVYAPVNRFHRFPGLVTPESQGNLRAPNNDTLYFSGWFDISEEPLVIHTPDTAGRYFTIAVTNQYSEVVHIGRRTHGTNEQYFALVAPDWGGALPGGVQPIVVESDRGWLLGRMLVDGPADLAAAQALVAQVWSASLSEFVPGVPPPLPPEQLAEPSEPLGSLEFFEIMNQALKQLAPRPDEAALMSQFNAIGVGPAADFDAAALAPPQREGLEAAIADGAAVVQAATRRTLPSVNGWTISRAIGRYPGNDYLHRASVVRGGYGNLPEESLYPATLFDSEGRLLSGRSRYRLHFAPGALPPVDGFWSLSVYDLETVSLVPNEIERYSIGDRTPGLVTAEDGSLTLRLQHERPSEPDANWLPTPRGNFLAVMRLYEPARAALDGSYVLPPLEEVR